MDKETKSKLLSNLLTGQKPKPIIERVELPQSSLMQEVGNEDKIFEYRKQLKKIHMFEKIVKEDSENWDDGTWKKFEEWINPSSVEGMLSQVIEKKQETLENDPKKQLREQALKLVNFNLLEKLMS